MKLLVFGKPQLYTEKRDFARLLDRLQESGRSVEWMDGISRDSVALMELYGVVALPGFVAMADDGSIHGLWQHSKPTFDELVQALGPAV